MLKRDVRNDDNYVRIHAQSDVQSEVRIRVHLGAQIYSRLC